MNSAGIDWCWLALGSEGRGEQTLATDQDNAIVFHPAEPAELEAERERLMAYAAEVNDALARLGFPLCTGGVMAREREMCLSQDEWKARFLGWLSAPTPEALLSANILFDFRAIHGNATLADALRSWLLAYSGESRVFLRLLVQNALQASPPLGLIRAFATDDEPPHRGTLDLKVRGTRMFVDAARVFALGLGLARVRHRRAAARGRGEARHRTAARRGDDRRLPVPAAPAPAAAGPGDVARHCEPPRSGHAERSRPAHAEGDVPPGAQAPATPRADVPDLNPGCSATRSPTRNCCEPRSPRQDRAAGSAAGSRRTRCAIVTAR